MSYYLLSAIVNALTSTLAGFYILLKNPRSGLNRSFFYFSSSVAFWAYCYLLWQLSNDAKSAIFWSRALMAGAIFISPTFFHFSIAFIEEYKKYSRLILFCYIVSIVFFFINFTPLLVKDVIPQLSFPYWPIAGIMYTPFLVGFFGIVVYVHILMYEAYKRSSGLKRNQIKYVFLGTIIGFSGGSTNYPLWYEIPILPFGNILVSIYVFLLAYTIVRYRLMDIKIAVTSAGIFICIYALVLGIPFWLSYGWGLWGEALWLMLVLATAGPFIYIVFQRKAEHKILENEIRTRNLLGRVSSGLTIIREKEKLLKLIVSVISKTLSASPIHIYLQEANNNSFRKSNPVGSKELIPSNSPLVARLKKSRDILIYEELQLKNAGFDEMGNHELLNILNSMSAKVVVPFFLQDNVIGFLALGERGKKETYNEYILSALRVMGNQIALAIENCQFLAAEKEMLKKEGARARRESLDMLVSTMAHEIDNPITSVIGHADIISEYIQNNKTKISEEDYSEIIKSANYVMKDAARVSKIIKAVEDYSKGGEGKLKEVSFYNALDPFHTLLMLVKKKISGVHYTEEIEPSLPSIMAEQILIEEVLLNFSENAFHAVKEKTGVKNVTLKVFNKNNFLRIEMIDNGYGIPQNILKQLFEVPTTTKGSSEGTGIGLYRIRQICNILKAKYGAESKGPGQGALFYVEIPFAAKGEKNG